MMRLSRRSSTLLVAFHSLVASGCGYPVVAILRVPSLALLAPTTASAASTSPCAIGRTLLTSLRMSSEATMTKATTDLPKSIKLYYPNFPFWRAEVLRASLYLQGIPFENITDRDVLKQMKERSPFGGFPVLEIDGKLLSQTQACATYVGKLGGKMYPPSSNILAQANCDEIINGCTDCTNTISRTFTLPTDEEKKVEREKLIDREQGGRLYKHLHGLDTVVCQDGSIYACGKDHGLTIADIAVWRLVGWFAGGSLDHVPKDFILTFPNLKTIYENVEKNDKIVEYKNKFYPET